MENLQKHGAKYAAALGVVFLLRLLPYPPNVEPITATLMPFGKHMGWVGGALFGICAIILYDLTTGTLGPWTTLTASGYTLLGAASVFYFKNSHGKISYVWFAIVGTILYDIATGLSVGPLFFNQPFMEALVGQVPFTLYHLAGNIVLALSVSPLIEKWIVTNPRFELSASSVSMRA